MTLEAVPTPLPAATADAVTELARAAAESDGVNPLSEQTLLHLHGEHPGDTHVLAYRGSPGADSLVGYGYLGEDGTAELVVAPSYRRQGYGSGLLRILLDHGGSDVRVWAHGRLPGSDELAQAADLTVTRELYFLRRPASPLPPVTWPAGITVRTFSPGEDDDAWLAVNAAAFANHPEQGAWTRNDLLDRLNQPWFDPTGFFLAVAADDTIAGFHWTKIENNEGEVYVVGVNPTHQGKGLGRSLTLQGLHHLQETHHLPTITLYVDGTNTTAHHLYTTLGFTTAALHVQYAPSPSVNDITPNPPDHTAS